MESQKSKIDLFLKDDSLSKKDSFILSVVRVERDNKKCDNNVKSYNK